jgi:peptide/nickel transport system substrate-binding protein
MRLRLFTLFAVAALLVGACGGSSSASPSSSGSEASAPASSEGASASAGGESPAASGSGGVDLTATKYKAEDVGNKGGNLVIGISGDPSSFWFNTYDTFANDCEAFCPAMWGLWNNTMDLKYYGQLASDVPTVANGGVTVNGTKMDVKVNLRDGANWSDGQPITCDDVIYNLQWFMDKNQAGLASGTSGYEDITSIDGAGTTKCTLHFGKIFEPYLTLFSPLYPAHYLKKSSVADAQKNLYVDTKLKDGVYSGPYIPTAWSHDAQINYVPNDQFWKTIKKSDPPFTAVTMKFYSDTDAEIAGFSNNETDVGLEFNQNQLAAMQQLDPATVDKVLGPTYEQHTWNYKSLTTKFGDAGAKAMMEALHYAVDKDAINQTITGGVVTPSCNGIYPDAWFYSDTGPCYKYDTAKAASILEAAGFTKGSDGTLTMNGNKAELLGCARQDRQYRLDTLQLLASQLKPLGITLSVKGVPPANVFAGWTSTPASTPCNTTHGNFDVAEFAWVATPDPGSNYYLYHSSFDPDQGDHAGQNYLRVHNPAVDKDMDTIKTSVDLPKIQEAMADFQKIYTDPAQAFPEIALYNWTTVMLKSPKMHNIANNGSASVQTWNIEDWWKGA